MVLIPIDIVIKIFSYLRKLIPRHEFLKLRLFLFFAVDKKKNERKIADTFIPDYYFLKHGEFISCLPKTIRTLGFYKNYYYYDIKLDIIIESKWLQKLDVKELKDCYYDNILLYYGADYDHIISYKGPYWKKIEFLKKLKKITLLNVRKKKIRIKNKYLEKLVIYFKKNSEVVLELGHLKNLKYLYVYGNAKVIQLEIISTIKNIIFNKTKCCNIKFFDHDGFITSANKKIEYSSII